MYWKKKEWFEGPKEKQAGDKTQGSPREAQLQDRFAGLGSNTARLHSREKSIGGEVQKKRTWKGRLGIRRLSAR